MWCRSAARIAGQWRLDGGDRLGAAARLFYLQCYHATGIKQLIDEAAVAKASFYQAFPDEIIGFIGIKTISNYVNHIAQTPVDEQFSAVTEMPAYQGAIKRTSWVSA